MKKEEIANRYRELSEKYNTLAHVEKRYLLVLSLLRLVVFIGGIILTVAGFMYSSLAGVTSLFLVAGIFILLLLLYSRHSEKMTFFSNISVISKNELRALGGDLSPFEDGSEWIDQEHDFSNDIDLFGGDSLFRFLNRTVTGYGKAILAGWLKEPEKLTSELTERQEVISELAGKLSWRQEFLAHGMGQSLAEQDVRSLINWLDDDSSILASPVSRISVYLLPAVTLSALLIVMAGFMHYSFFIFFFLLNLLVTALFLRITNRIHNTVSKKFVFLSSLGHLMNMFTGEEFISRKLAEVKQNLTSDNASAISGIRKLSRIIQSFDSRLNFMIGFVLNGLLLWDLHCIKSLERWKGESAGLLPEWLMKIGEVDAYISLANYAYNNPVYTYPALSSGHEILVARAMGHPLISDDVRISNDFSIERKGMLGIITGANMAGKSTFLRTVAVNFVLGMTGAPVCCTSMNFSNVRLFTSMRTTDSLSHNESYFYAELKRLKSLKARIEQGEEILFILDEILKGTNSEDKSAGSRLFIRKMIEHSGTGLIATHDISLGKMEEEYPELVFNKCFEIEINGENISFDYLLRDGITTVMNAALLMKQMGIAD